MQLDEIRKKMSDPTKLCTRVALDKDQVVNRKAFAQYLWFQEEAADMRAKVGKVEGAYEKARDCQKTANEYYMIALGLRPGTVSENSAGKPPGSAGSRPSPPQNSTNTTVDEQEEKDKDSDYQPSTEDEKDESSEESTEAPAAKPKKPKNKKVKHDKTTATATKKWARCTAPALAPKLLAELSKLVQDRWSNGLAHDSFVKNYPIAKYYCFAERVCRHYLQLWTQHKRDKLHLNRENLTRAAVATVYNECQPYHDKPHFGNNSIGRTNVLPLLEHVFKMPLEEHNRRGSDAWIKHVLAHARYNIVNVDLNGL